MTDAEDIGKLFVGGLSWETTRENLQSYFSHFGEIVDCVVMKNNETGRSRGFGFVTFKDPNCVNAVLQAKPHDLNGRTIDAKECTPRSMQKRGRSSNQSKIFLGGLPRDITESDIRNAMSKFGQVSQVIIMMDSETKKCRGFGFLSFESEDSTEQVCAMHYVDINGKQIECKRAQARENVRRNPAQSQPHMNSQNFYQPPFGSSSMGTSNFQSNWNQSIAQSSYVEPGNAFNGYQSYAPPAAAAAPSANIYGQTMPSYNSMPASQYSVPSYSSYGSQPTNIPPSMASYDYAHQHGNNLPQSSTTSYSQNFSTFPGPKNSSPAMSGRPYDSNAGYSQEPYGSTKMYDDFSSKVPTKGTNYDNAVSSFPKSQGYHPYRR